MKKLEKNEKSWVEKKLSNAKFKKGFQEEYTKLSIGEQLASLRSKAKMTQAAVAKKVGTTPSAISRYESADYDRYELQTLRKIVEACGGKMEIRMESAKSKDAA